MWGCQQSEEKQLWTLLEVFFTLFFFFLSQQVDKMFYTCILIHIRHICRQNVFKEGDINGNLYLLWYCQNFVLQFNLFLFSYCKISTIEMEFALIVFQSARSFGKIRWNSVELHLFSVAQILEPPFLLGQTNSRAPPFLNQKNKERYFFWVTFF